jgi:hypothetical protein
MMLLNRALSMVGSMFNRIQLAADGDRPTPESDMELQAHYGSHEFPPYVTKIIGEFKPHSVGITRKIMMRYSPDVDFMSALVRSPIVNMRWTIESRDPQLAALVDAMVRPIFPELSRSASLSPLYGFQVQQPIWQSGPFSFDLEDKAKGQTDSITLPAAWSIKRVKGIDPRTITLHSDEKTDEFSSVTQDRTDGKSVTVDASELLLWTHRVEDEWGRLTGLGIYDSAYTPWYDQSGLIFLRNTYFEGRAHPTPIGYATNGTAMDKDNKPIDATELMRKALAALKSRSYVVLSGKRDEKGNRHNEIQYLTDDKRGDMFQQAIDAEGVRILKCGLIPGESATSEPQGSRARAEVHENRLGEIQQSRVGEFVSRILQPVVDRVILFNKGRRALEESKTFIKAWGLSPGKQQLYKEVLLKIMDAEATLAEGESVPLRKRLDAIGMADDLEMQLRPLDEAQEEWDQEREERDAKAAAIAGGEGGVKVTPEMEKQVQEDLARIGATSEE